LEKRGLRDALTAHGITGATPLGFADEMRLGLRGTVRRVWGRRGVKVGQAVQFTYQWRYLFLAVDAPAGRLHWCWLPNLTTAQIAGAVRGLRQQTNLTGLVWDRGAGHRTATVRAVGIPLVELPPYSPELNPAERVFEELRRMVEGKVYPTLDAKVAAVVAHLAWLEADPDRVRSLTHWSWIVDAFQQGPRQNAA
jgi:transposase